jgi:hypothetical protein
MHELPRSRELFTDTGPHVVRARQSLSLRFLNLCALPSAWTIIKMIHDKRALAKLNIDHSIGNVSPGYESEMYIAWLIKNLGASP